MVSHSAISTAWPRMPPDNAISSTPAAALNVLAINSAGWVPILIEIGSASPLAGLWRTHLSGRGCTLGGWSRLLSGRA